MPAKQNSKTAFEGATNNSRPPHEEPTVVAFPSGNPVPPQAPKKPAPPTSTVDRFAHVTKVPVAQQIFKLLDMPQPMKQQQQGVIMCQSKEAIAYREAYRNQQIATQQKAAMRATL